MNIIVCVKQVPDTTEIKIDPVKKTLIRDGVPSILNTYDAYALEQALRLKDANPETKITCVSMGPPQAEKMLRDCLAVGADKAYLVTDRKFGGSDTLATSYILKTAIEKVEEFEGKADMIFCGKQAIDGDTAQVGPEIAEQLDIAQVTYGISIEVVDGKAHVTREVDTGNEIVETVLPALVTFTKTFDLRYPTIKTKMKAKKAEIGQITYDDLEGLIDDKKIGLKGSPTRVKKTFTPTIEKQGVILRDEESIDMVNKLVAALEASNII